MILQRLVEYYDRLANGTPSDQVMATPGYSWQKVSFCIVLYPDGRLQALQSMLERESKRLVPRELLVPGTAKPSGSGLNPCLLWDNATYMLGFKTDDPNPKRTIASFEAFRERHFDLEKEINHPWFTAVCSFLRSWTEENVASHAEQLKEIAQHFGVFRIAGENRLVHEAVPLPGGTSSSHVLGTCLVSGQHNAPIARLHEPEIKNVRGSHSFGAKLVSFEKEAFKSFGKTQSFNAPVSELAAFKYANALNYLLGQRGRRLSLGDSTVVFWAESATPIEDLLADLLGEESPPAGDAPSEENRERLGQVRHLLSQLRDGTEYANAIAEDVETKFFILGLSGNNARLSVRLWVETDVGELKKRLGEHLRDLSLYDARAEWPPSLQQIVAATGRAEVQRGRFKGFDTKQVSPLLAGALACSVLTGDPYPQALLATLLSRIRADGIVHHHRCSAIKGCLVRNSRARGNPKEVSVALDVNQPEPAYNLGRLFALLEKIQTDSVEGELNATIKDRYFSSASTTPAVVFPRLLRLNQHHLAKLAIGTRIYYEKLLGGVMGVLTYFPRYLPLEDQGQFAIGYFHQRQDLFKSRKSDSQGEDQ